VPLVSTSPTPNGILAALPIVSRRADGDRRVRIGFVRAALAVAAGVRGATVADQEPPANGDLAG
jgi:hypothetical protein